MPADGIRYPERFQAKHALGLDPGVETGSRQEDASNQGSRAPFRFNRNGKGLVQDVAAVLERSAEGDRRVKLLQLRLQLLVDQEERPQRAVDVAIATGYDPVDRRF